MVNGKSCTICWYVDDNKISHAEQSVLEDILHKLKVHFGELTVTCGNTHTLLGMSITIRDDSKFEVDQVKHLHEAIEIFGEDASKKISSVASVNLYKIDKTSKQLSAEKSEILHSVTAKLLYTMQRGRPNLKPPITFLCTRVSKRTKNDWRKLKRVLQSVNQTIDRKIIIGASSLTELFTWVDTTIAAHTDMRSQTGSCMPFGWGTIHWRSSKQN